MWTKNSSRTACASLALLLIGCGPSSAPEPHEPTAAEAPAANTAPAPKDERLGVAFEALGRGDVEACQREARAVLADFPHHPRAEFLLALGLHKAKRYAEARPLFESAESATASFAGKDAVPYYLGWCGYWLGDFEAARAAFERHLEGSDEGDSHFGLGAIALELGHFDEARAKLTRALEIFAILAAA